jgi:hypothetical protein
VNEIRALEHLMKSSNHDGTVALLELVTSPLKERQ